ncbi:MAG: hypothetical protein NTZ02_00165 [Candidatus Woesearchaeota archaeon]|nr:hypothetical protein [Candidatus Woesearchaeota archaeon]
MQAAAGLLAGIVALVVLFLMTMSSGGGMLTFKTKMLFSLGIVVLVFAAPYIAPFLSGITGGG